MANRADAVCWRRLNGHCMAGDAWRIVVTVNAGWFSSVAHELDEARLGCDLGVGMSIRIRVLGPVSVSRLGNHIDLGEPQQRAVLGLLALAGGQPLSRAELVDALWSGHPPPSAENMIQTYLKRLRRLLEPDRLARARSTILPTVGDGYALRLPAEDIDLLRFRRLVAAADEHDKNGEPHRAAALLGEGLSMWSGSPFCDVPALFRHPRVVSLSVEWQTAVARYGEAMIAIGAAASAMAVLSAAAATQPLNEALLALLIRAHVAIGQRSTALAIYRETSRRLAEELGMDPGPELSAAHAALLNGTTRHRYSARPAQSATRTSPARLPAVVTDFTGRTAQLAELDQLLTPHGTVAISVISGAAGVGKTALAVQWTHRVRDRFPDGQLYVDLRGYDADAPVPAGDALTRFLVALGVAERHVPLDVEHRAAKYRTELAGRRMLVMLDNAATSDQVRPLLPGTTGCAVLVTSRDSLTGLVARHGTRRLALDPLSLAVPSG
jgi:DNA-binding SARP family transcriptional activator